VQKNAPPQFSLDLDNEEVNGFVLTNKIAETQGPISLGQAQIPIHRQSITNDPALAALAANPPANHMYMSEDKRSH
jgi:hypothetical protein